MQQLTLLINVCNIKIKRLFVEINAAARAILQRMEKTLAVD
jgi:hypothetical protein